MGGAPAAGPVGPAGPADPADPADPAGWPRVCRAGDLVVGRGVRALVRGQALALFRLADGSVHALGDHDPVAHAAGLSRGVVGRSGGRPFVAPLAHRHRFDLRTGRCLDDEHVAVPVYAVAVLAGVVRVGPRRGPLAHTGGRARDSDEPEAGPVTRLVTVAHGTRTTAANAVARELTDAAARALGVPGTAAYVELHEPLLTDVMATNRDPAVVVPLLLSTGFHVRHDVPEAVATSPAPVTLTPPLGPHPLLAAAQVARLREAGVEPGHPVVLVAAGSRDVATASDLCVARGHLAAAWGGDVRSAVLTGPGRRVEDVVRAGDAVSPYLLAGGFFATKAQRDCTALGASVVADVLGPHPRVVELVVERVRAALAAAAA